MGIKTLIMELFFESFPVIFYSDNITEEQFKTAKYWIESYLKHDKSYKLDEFTKKDIKQIAIIKSDIYIFFNSNIAELEGHKFDFMIIPFKHIY